MKKNSPIGVGTLYYIDFKYDIFSLASKNISTCRMQPGWRNARGTIQGIMQENQQVETLITEVRKAWYDELIFCLPLVGVPPCRILDRASQLAVARVHWLMNFLKKLIYAANINVNIVESFIEHYLMGNANGARLAEAGYQGMLQPGPTHQWSECGAAQHHLPPLQFIWAQLHQHTMKLGARYRHDIQAEWVNDSCPFHDPIPNPYEQI